MSREANKQLPTRHLSGQKLNSALYAASGPRGWRHPLLIKRMLATITPEIYNPQCVNVLRSQIEWYKKLNYKQQATDDQNPSVTVTIEIR
jgi:hypothetical protein